VKAVDDNVDRGSSYVVEINHAAKSEDSHYDGDHATFFWGKSATSLLKVQVNDNDRHGISFSTLPSQAHEGESALSLGIAIESEPVASVTIEARAIDEKLSIPFPTLTFSKGNWENEQYMDINFPSDNVYRGKIFTSRFVLKAFSSDAFYDSVYAAKFEQSNGVISIEVEENEQVNSFAETLLSYSLEQSEGTKSSSGLMTSILSQPENEVTLTLQGVAAASMSAWSYTFSPGNWFLPIDIPALPVDDHISHHRRFLLRPVLNFESVDKQMATSNSGISWKVHDNDLPIVSIASNHDTLAGPVMNEGSIGTSYSIVLLSKPATAVTVCALSDDDNLLKITSTSPCLTFGTASWDTSQFVFIRAVDDGEDRGSEYDVYINHIILSSDPSYRNGLFLPFSGAIRASIKDNDQATVLLGSGLGISEASNPGGYPVALSAKPYAPVTITVESLSPSKLSISGKNTLTFSQANWYLNQLVSVSGSENDEFEGVTGYFEVDVRHTATSSDNRFDGSAAFAAAGISNSKVKIFDNDIARISFGVQRETRRGPAVSEGGGLGHYTVSLSAGPSEPVTISVINHSPNEIEIQSHPHLVFSSQNWALPQSVYLSAVENNIDNGYLYFGQISHSLNTSDLKFAGQELDGQMNVKLIDNDIAGAINDFAVASGSPSLGAQSGTDHLLFHLNSEPLDTVTIHIVQDGNNLLMEHVDPKLLQQQTSSRKLLSTRLLTQALHSASLTFSPNDWHVPQAVLLSANDSATTMRVSNNSIQSSITSQDIAYKFIASSLPHGGVLVPVVAAPVVTHIIPHSGPTTGATTFNEDNAPGVITIYGSYFGFEMNDVSVTIGSTPCAQAIIVDDRTIRCWIPPGAGKNLPVQIRFGSQLSNDNILFSYDQPLIFAIDPIRSPSRGGTFLRIIGANFGSHDISTFCRKPISASQDEISCESLPGYGSRATPVSTAGQSNPEYNAFCNTYEHEIPIITKISGCQDVNVSTTECPPSGDILLSIEGFNFGPNATITVGGELCINKPDPHSDGSLQCYMPKGVGSRVEVRVHQYNIMSLPVLIDYAIPIISVDEVHTASSKYRAFVASAIGLDSIDIQGGHFGDSEYADDNFVAISGTPCGYSYWVSSSVLRCSVPSGDGITDNVAVIVNDQASIENVHLSYTPFVENILPYVGRAAGGTRIMVQGQGILNTASLVCAVGSTFGTALFIDSHNLRCTAPPSGYALSIPTGLNMTLHIPFLTPTLGLEAWVNIKNHSYFEHTLFSLVSEDFEIRVIVSEGHVVMVNKNTSSLTSTVARNLTSSSTVNTSEWFHVSVQRNNNSCSLHINGILESNGSHASSCTFMNPAMFISNAIGDKSSTTTFDEIRVWDKIRSVHQIEYWYNRVDIPLSEQSGLVLLVHFSELQQTPDAAIFADAAGGANEVRCTASLCNTTRESESWHPIRQNVEISVDGGITFGNNGQNNQFLQDELPSIVSIIPPLGPTSGGTPVHITGLRFHNSKHIRCIFGSNKDVKITWLTSNDIICVSPAAAAGNVDVKVSLNDGEEWSLPVTFKYYTTPTISSVTKKGGFEFGVSKFGDSIEITMANLPSISSLTSLNFYNFSMHRCKFGLVSTPAIRLTLSKLTCIPPPLVLANDWQFVANGQVDVHVLVTVNGQDYQSPTDYQYWRPCPPGSYCAVDTSTGVQSVTPCKRGHYCPGEGNLAPIKCPRGTYQSNEGATLCLACTPGYYCHEEGMQNPALCPAGVVCDRDMEFGIHQYNVKSRYSQGADINHGISTLTALCPPGHFCRAGTSKHLKRDKVIGYRDSVYIGRKPVGYPAWQTSVDRCLDPGSNVGPNTPVWPCQCDSAYYCLPGTEGPSAYDKEQLWFSKNLQNICYSGFYCTKGSTMPQGISPCPLGFYCPVPDESLGILGLQPCDKGNFCDTPGLEKGKRCPPGTYNGKIQQTNCTNCAPGEICPVVDLDSETGLITPMVCKAGFVCDEQKIAFPKKSCPPGFFCPAGTATSTPCNDFQCKVNGTKHCRGGANHTLPCTSDHDCKIPSSDCTFPFTIPSCSVGRCIEDKACENDLSVSCEDNTDCPDTTCRGPFRCPLGYYCFEGSVGKTLQCPDANECAPGSRNHVKQTFSIRGFTKGPSYFPPNSTVVEIDNHVYTALQYPQQCLQGVTCGYNTPTPRGTGVCFPGHFCPSPTLLLENLELRDRVIPWVGSYYIDIMSCGNYLCKHGTTSVTTAEIEKGQGGITNEIQNLTITANEDMTGNFSISFNGESTIPLLANQSHMPSPEALANALQNLTSIGAGGVHVTLSNVQVPYGKQYLITFVCNPENISVSRIVEGTDSVAEVQELRLTGNGILGGRFTISYYGETSVSLSGSTFNFATALEVQNAMNDLKTIGRVNVTRAPNNQSPNGQLYNVKFLNGSVTISATTERNGVVELIPIQEVQSFAVNISDPNGTLIILGDTKNETIAIQNLTNVTLKDALENLDHITYVNVSQILKQNVPQTIYFNVTFSRNAGNVAPLGLVVSTPSLNRSLSVITWREGRLKIEAVPEVQVVTCSGNGVIGGSYQLTVFSNITDAIPFDASASEVKAALEALDFIASVQVIYLGSESDGFTYKISILDPPGDLEQIGVVSNLTQGIGSMRLLTVNEINYGSMCDDMPLIQGDNSNIFVPQRCTGGSAKGSVCTMDLQCPPDPTTWSANGAPQRCQFIRGSRPAIIDEPPARKGHFALGTQNAYDSRCAPGTYADHIEHVECKPCIKGHKCPKYEMDTPVICAEGFICQSPDCENGACTPEKFMYPGYAVEEVLCTGGYYCESGTDSYVDSGKHGNCGDSSNVTCLQPKRCPNGTYCMEGVGKPNYVNGKDGHQLYPQPCTEGYFCADEYYELEGIDCQNGNSCFERDKPDGDKSGIPGSGIPNPPNNKPQGTAKCPAGTYCVKGRAIPVKADPGFSVPTAASSAQTLCQAGRYSSTSGQANCVFCNAGSYQNEVGKSSCKYCDQGHYMTDSDRKRRTECVACTAGTYVRGMGSAFAENCTFTAPGYLCTMQGLGNCKGDRGFDANGIALPAGCRKCPEGYVCPPGTNQLRDTMKCPSGFFCGEGATRQQLFGDDFKDILPDITCLPDVVSGDANAGRCPSKYFCPQGTLRQYKEQKVCLANHYCPEGSPASIPCPPGTKSTAQNDALSNCIIDKIG
jgi:hypothetical protein